MFPSTTGTVLLHSNIVNGAYYPLQVRTGVVDGNGDAKYRLHSLRHFCASNWIDIGFAPKETQSWMGHASITMTFDVCRHLMASLEDDHEKLAAGELAIVG